MDEIPHPLKVKDARDLDTSKYTEVNDSNPYIRKFGSRVKSFFSQSKNEIFDSDEEGNENAELANATSNTDLSRLDTCATMRPCSAHDLPGQ